MADELIALFEFEYNQDKMKIYAEKHYRLVSPDQMSAEDLLNYRNRLA